MFSITADELPRFMACQGSATLDKFQSLPPDNPARAEGIAAHWLIEQVCKGHHTLEELIDRRAPNDVLITSDMVDDVKPYVETISIRGHVERNTSFKGADYEIRARADHVELFDRVLTIRDFKYGWGIVEPEMNWSMIAHAIGFSLQMTHESESFDILKDIEHVNIVIYQPRPYHPEGKIRKWSITPQQMVELHEQISLAATNPDKRLQTGKHCKNCPSAPYCPAFSAAVMNVLDVSERAFTDEIDNDSLAFMLDNLNRASEIVKQGLEAYSDLAIHRMRNGTIIQGYMMQNDLTNKVWKSGITAEFVKSMTGVDVSKSDIITPAQAKKAGVPDDVVEAFCERRNKGFKLVRQDVNKTAKKLFN
jgi:hypothetical protein